MKTIVFFLFLSIIFIFNACKDKDCTKDGSCAPEFYRFELGEAKSYLWALPGSYWIYKNTSNGDLDTQTVTGFDYDSIMVKGTESYSKHIVIKYFQIRRSVFSSLNHFIYYDKTGEHTPDDNSFKDHTTKLLRNGVLISFFYPFKKDVIFALGTIETKGIGTSPIEIIQKKTYSDVVQYEINLDGLWENSPPFTASRYYWAKGVGLIKRTATHKSDNWELIEYNIIK